jgi:hypothetical protein
LSHRSGHKPALAIKWLPKPPLWIRIPHHLAAGGGKFLPRLTGQGERLAAADFRDFSLQAAGERKMVTAPFILNP